MKKIIFTLLCFAIFIPACKEKNDLQGKEFYHKHNLKDDLGWTDTTITYEYWVMKFISNNKVVASSHYDSINGAICGHIDTTLYILEYPNINFFTDSKGNVINGKIIDENTFRIGDKEFILRK